MESNRPFRFGILGPGGIAESAHGPALKVLAEEGIAELWSVCGRHLDRVEEFATDFGATAPSPIYTEYERFFRDPELDAVIVCTPDGLHCQQAVAAMRAGKHVFVEKPMATTETDADHMVHVSQQTGRTIGVGYHMRYHAGHRALREEIRSGRLGGIQEVTLEWSTLSMSPDGWRGMGRDSRWWALAALGTHALDLVSWLVDQEPDTIGGTVRYLAGTGPDTQVSLRVAFSHGTKAKIRVSVVDSPAKLIALTGSTRLVACIDTLGSRGVGRINFPDLKCIPFVPVSPYVEQLRAYVEAIRDNRQPEVNGDVGLQNVRWLELADAQMTRR